MTHLEACIEAVPEVLRCGCEPTAVEFMEREVIACAETYLGKQFPDTSARRVSAGAAGRGQPRKRCSPMIDTG